MANIIREGDVDIDALKARVTPQDGEEACCRVLGAMTLLDGLRRLRGENEPPHELMRALSLVYFALTDAFDL